MNESARRPLKTRQYKWAHKLAHFFVVRGMTPNQMSLLSIPLAVFGAFSLAATLLAPPILQSFLLVFAALCIQLRLLSNMLDGLMAVEENKKTATGALFNEMPDRVCDILFLSAAGYAVGAFWLGLTVALLSVLTAYVRALGASLGNNQDYSGPMAKPHRMFALTIGCLSAAFMQETSLLGWALIVILIGCILTVVRRVVHLIRFLEQAK